MPTVKRILRRTKTLLWTAFSIIVVLLAIGAGIGKLLMPYSVHYQPELEQWLSREFGQPVSIDSFEGDWTAFGPRLTLRGLALGDTNGTGDGDSAEVVIESAALDIRPLSHLLTNAPLYNFRVIGADFELVRDADGEFHLSGFGVSNRDNGSALQDLVRVGEVVLQDSSLLFVDEILGIRLGLAGINGRLELEGEELASKVRAVLHDPRSGLEYGRLDATGVLSLSDGELNGAEWRLRARELMLASFQGKLPSNPFLPLTGWLDAEAWGYWSRNEGLRMNGTVSLDDALLVSDMQDIHLERARSRFRWRHAGAGHWNLHLADFFLDRGDASWRSPRLSVARDVANGVGLWISADELPFGAPLNLTREIMSIYGHAWPENAPLDVDGQVSELDLVLSPDWRLTLARGRVEDARVAAWGRWPALNGLSGSVDLADGAGEVTLAGRRVEMDWPGMFGEPLSFELLPCRIELEWGGQPAAGFRACGLENEDLALNGDLFVVADGGRPSMDLNFLVSRAEIGQLQPYWPQSAMPETVVAWLRQALRGGQLKAARAQVHGDLDNWPFRGSAGRFEAVAWIDSPVIRYLDDWPQVTGGENVIARFRGAGVEVNGSVADTAGASVEDVFVEIADFSRPLLEIRYAAEPGLPALRGFVEQTPLLELAGVELSSFEFSGPAAVSGEIRVPLGRTPGEFEVDGRVRLDGAGFAAPEQRVEISAIRGEVAYDERGFQGHSLEGLTLEEPVQIDIAARSQSNERFRAELTGVFDVQDLLLYDPLRTTLHDRLGGRGEWFIELTAGARPLTLEMRSSLEGVSIDFPAPFDKPAAEAWPFALSLPLGENSDGPLRIELADRGALALDLDDSARVGRAALALGGGEPALPGEGQFRITGAVAELDLDGWIALAIDHAELAGPDGLSLEEATAQADEMLFLDRTFSDVGVGLDVRDSDLLATFDATDIDGQVRFSNGDDGPGSLFAEFERLVLGPAQSDGVSMETDPGALPVLHLYANSFSYLGIELGETRIEAYPTSTGLHFEKVEANSEALSLQASGDWFLSGEEHRSDFRINMASESLGDFLHSLDISSSVLGGQTLVSFNAQWAGAPANFALSRLNGEVEFSVVDGNITGASAGPGRLLGLVSFTALPKRLALDFRDVFESGFSFDQANGTFVLEDGVAMTDDLLLESSSASIAVSGKTDLVGRQYDQLMTIRPGVGNTLPIIGALTAGPGGAAAGLALQGLLHDSLAEATQVRYTITGSWDEPVIEPVEVERAGG